MSFNTKIIDLKDIFVKKAEGLKDPKTDEETLIEKIKEFMKENENEKLPVFHKKSPSPSNSLSFKIRGEASKMYINTQKEKLLDQEELNNLRDTLEKSSSPPFSSNPNDKFMNYNDYKNTVAKLNSKCRVMLTPKLFLKLLTDDPYGRVPINSIFNYVMKKTWLNHTRLGLSLYDDDGKGFLNEDDLGAYIEDILPKLGPIARIKESFMPFYICSASRKFFFFLDPYKTGKIRILDILCSNLLEDIMELSGEEDAIPKKSNWFSPQSVMKTYTRFLVLNESKSGMISKEEFLNYGEGNVTLTETFVNRLFQVYLTCEGEIDYKTYLDFVLAYENMNEPQAILYFFRILDIDDKGFLDGFTLNYFFKDINKYLEGQASPEIVLFEDIKDEIFDMVKPKDSNKINLKDLINSGKGATVIQILIDFKGFWAYETRDNLTPETYLNPERKDK